MPSDAESVVVFKLLAIKPLYKIGQREVVTIAERQRLAEQRFEATPWRLPDIGSSRRGDRSPSRLPAYVHL